jgi:NADP-dependent 3-hydroxy acid dehydrogenase YdfG
VDVTSVSITAATSGIDREPGEHFGPGAAHVVARGHSHDRLERSRVEFARFVEHRVLTMTPTERRQLNALMKWNPSQR